MRRRKFLTLIILGGVSAMGFLFSRFFTKRKIKNVVKSTFYLHKPTLSMPLEGQAISVETTLNSRCTSDDDGNPEKFHWGMFDKRKKLSSEQIRNIISLAKIPRFTEQKVEFQAENNVLTFVVESRVSGITRDWMMVESGMQQQAVGLVCAALGVGMVFKNLGKEGTSISDTDYATIKIRLGPMKPTYSGSFWSNLTPAGRSPWLTGNLPDPIRDGGKPLLATLANLGTHNKSSRKSTEGSVSQLLWAARGRTPHLYKSRPWGMTIPTWAGEQNISTVYLASNNRLSKYINWDSKYDKPTHALAGLNKVDDKLVETLIESFFVNHTLIILGKNENFARALWEVGYQLLNLLLQANSLNIPYQASLLNEKQKSTIVSTGLRNPVAILAI